ncbi:MAG: hypothetical protein FWD82_06710 [Defluviitaleaceae bacterium]|nr:hypothetical protein [Defluviitaleaceae bacterium]
MEKKENLVKYFWLITYAHTIAYFIAGATSMVFMNYEKIWATEIIASFYRSIDTPIIYLGTILQIPRGILIALFILPLRKAFFEDKYGLLKLGLIVFGFSAISTIGAVWASYEGYIYLKLPLEIHLMGYPEILLYISLFIGILFVSQKFAHKKIITILSIIFMVIICFSGIMSYMLAKGYIVA